MMRLGNLATVKSTQKGSDRWNSIHFRWDRFDDPNLFLDGVEVNVEDAGAADVSRQGTEIEIRSFVEFTVIF